MSYPRPAVIAMSALLAISATAAQAQTAQHSDQAGSHNPAMKDSDPHQVMAPAQGSNSFTEDQARKRLAKAGYVVTDLKKNDAGVWRGTASKAGKQLEVGLDYKGNVTTR